MLEHFGIKDIWVVIKKNIYLIMIIGAVFTALFSFITYHKIKSLNCSHQEGQPIYASSLSYYVQPNITDMQSEKTEWEYYHSLPNDYVALLNTDACACYVYEGICKLYSDNYLKKNSELDVQNLKNLPFVQSIKKLYKVKRYNNTMIFNVYALAYNEELSRSILSLLREYLEINVEKRIKESNLELSGEAIKIISSASELDDDDEVKTVSAKASNTKAVIKLLIKNTFIPLIGVIIVLLFILILRAFFNPTLNRKSDFAEYDVPILGEINGN